MKVSLTKARIKQIIKEELTSALSTKSFRWEGGGDPTQSFDSMTGTLTSESGTTSNVSFDEVLNAMQIPAQDAARLTRELTQKDPEVFADQTFNEWEWVTVHGTFEAGEWSFETDITIQ